MKFIFKLIFSLTFSLFSKFLKSKPGFIIFQKELTEFFSSLTGYVVISIFLIANGLFLWIFPGEYNVMDNGYANLDTLFFIAPWIFLFLVPAVTMHSFSDERRTGTIELLFTRPLTITQIVFAKYFAGIALVIFSLIPSLIYYLTVGYFGNPQWNIDIGAFWGSYIGLFFLASIYVAIGIFASSFTENQIIAFLVAMIISFFIYIGFESVSELNVWGTNGYIIEKLGINAHYKSMSKGVLDTRDIEYFIAVAGIFLVSTKFILSRKTK